MLEHERDIRVVVGYQAEAVIETARKYRDDILFVFNHQYRETGTGASVALAAKYAGEFILSLDGDLLVHPEDLEQVLACDHEFVSGGEPVTDDPWLLQTYQEEGTEFVSSISALRTCHPSSLNPSAIKFANVLKESVSDSKIIIFSIKTSYVFYFPTPLKSFFTHANARS